MNIETIETITDTDTVFSYKYDDKYFTIMEKVGDKPVRELYWFEKDRCRTLNQQYDWIHQVLTKSWMTDGWNFIQHFEKAINSWFNITINNKESK